MSECAAIRFAQVQADEYSVDEDGVIVALERHLNNEPCWDHLVVTYEINGFMSSEDKVRLDTIYNEFTGGAGGGTSFAVIDDATTATTSTWSSTKIVAEIAAGVAAGSSDIEFPQNTLVSNDLTPKVIDTFPEATADTVEYWIKITSGSNNYSSKFMIQHEGGIVYLGAEYNVLGSTGSNPFGELDAEVVAPNVRVTFTPNTASALSITIVRIGFALS